MEYSADPEAQVVKPRILIVEDEVLIRAYLSEELRDAGFAVIEAAHAEEALSYLKAGEKVDLVFSDIHMPGSFNGLELARRLRDLHPSLPIILTSGNPGPHAPDALFAAGVSVKKKT
jgi:CheY-like chemotaxis protein